MAVSFIGGRNGVLGDNHRPVANHWQTLSHKCCIEYTSLWIGFELTTSDSVVIGTDSLIAICIGIPVNPPPLRWSLPHKSLISRMDWVSCAGDINLPHTLFPLALSPPNKKIKYNKILTYILRLIFLEILHLELPRWWKTPIDTNGKGV